MRFLVICRAIEPPPVGYPDQIELLQETQRQFRSRADQRLRQVLSFAGERGYVVVIEASSARELDRIVFGLPAEPLCSLEVHAVIEDELSDPHEVVR